MDYIRNIFCDFDYRYADIYQSGTGLAQAAQ